MDYSSKNLTSNGVKNIVVLGGGTGTPSVLRGLKAYSVKLSAVVSVADDGGSSGVLQKELGILPPGAVRKPLLSLARKEAFWHPLFEYRFEKGSLKGHPLGNIFLAAAALSQKNFQKAIDAVQNIIEAKGEVIPVSLEHVRLIAHLENGDKVYGETNIDVPKHNANLRITRVSLASPARANPRALKAIKDARLIVIGPGDLYSSIIPNFLVNGICEAIKKSKAKKVYVTNLMTKYGETNQFRASHFAAALQKYCSFPLDYCVVNTQKPLTEKLALYQKEHSEFVVPDKKALAVLPTNVIYGKLLLSGPLYLRHDPKKLAKILMKIPNSA